MTHSVDGFRNHRRTEPIDVPDARADARRDPGRTVWQDAAKCDGFSRDPRTVVSLRHLLHPGTEPPNAAMMLPVVGLGANVVSALLLAHPGADPMQLT